MRSLFAREPDFQSYTGSLILFHRQYYEHGNRKNEIPEDRLYDANYDLTTLDDRKTLTVMLRITKDGISVEGTDISGWENQGSIKDEIEM
ncbi:hypothetical protein ABHZ61_01820 [Bacteroides thetaiotaomicron]|uniref:hypothetical protein n=1 Tax=Bacteroides thetaiotaomicron TaxID=818 RepID=UPI00325FE0AD